MPDYRIFPIMPNHIDFLREMSSILPPDERLVIDIVDGNPSENENMRRAQRKTVSGQRKDWNSFFLPPGKNVYVCVMAIAASEVKPNGSAPRRAELFKSGVALMVDDVGDVNKARGIKVPKDILTTAPPTALVETSEGNFQAWYFFKEPLKDADKFDRLIRAFIREQLMGHDPGMSSIARIARIPFGRNLKPSRDNFKVRLESFRPECRYSPDELIELFNLELEPPRVHLEYEAKAKTKWNMKLEVFKYEFLKEHLRSNDRKNAEAEARRGEWKVLCPNAGNHSAGSVGGTTILHPSTQRYGSTQFMCIHTSCFGIFKTKEVIQTILEDEEAKDEWIDGRRKIRDEYLDSLSPEEREVAIREMNINGIKGFLSRCSFDELADWMLRDCGNCSKRDWFQQMDPKLQLNFLNQEKSELIAWFNCMPEEDLNVWAESWGNKWATYDLDDEVARDVEDANAQAAADDEDAF
jgi:hypothetical protein